MKKKIYSLFVAMALVIGVMSSASVSNASIRTESGTRKFVNDWQAKATSGNGTLVYGYDTFMINEDYAWGYHSTKQHYARVKNANGLYSSSWEKAGKTASIEVRHSGSSIVYFCNWN